METPKNTPDLAENDVSTAKRPTVKWYPYFLLNGNLKEKELKQAFEIADCPTRDDVETAIIESRFHPSGKYRVEKKKNGQPTSDFFYCEKPEMSFFQRKPPIEFGSDFDDSSGEYSEQSTSQLEDLVSQLFQKFEDLETRIQDRPEAAQVSNNETGILQIVREMQRQSERNSQQSDKSFMQGLQMAQTLIQAQQPQQNTTQMMLEMLQGTLAVQKGVRELAEEIAPDNSNGGSTSFLSDAAKVIDSIGKNAGNFTPLLMSALGGSPAARQTVRPQTAPTTNGNGNQSSGETSNLSEMFSKIKETETEKK